MYDNYSKIDPDTDSQPYNGPSVYIWDTLRRQVQATNKAFRHMENDLGVFSLEM